MASGYYQSNYTGAEIDEAVRKVVEGEIGGASSADDVTYGDTTVAAVLDDLLYETIAITSLFSNPSGSVERGREIADVKLSWVVNKTPTTLTLNGDTIDNTLTSITLEGVDLTSTTTYALVATDERSATANKSVTLTFLPGVYYGADAVPDDLDSAFILSLTKKLASSRTGSWTVDANTGEYLWFAIPSSYGTPTFTVGGFSGGFSLAAKITFVNSYGYSASYDVWRSDNSGLGSTTVTVT